MANHLLEAINDFRRDNWTHEAIWQDWIADKCYYHCEYMADNNMFFHAPAELRDWCAECVSYSKVFLNERDQIRHMVFDLLGSSPSHREIILSANEIGGCYYVRDNYAIITVRAR